MSVAAAARPAVSPSFQISMRRKVINKGWWLLCFVMLGLLFVPVVWILAQVFARAIPTWQWSVFTRTSTGTSPGLENAVVGSLVMLVGVAIVAGFIGIGCGLYLSEMAKPSWWTTILRSSTEVLSGIPSIVFGYVGYLLLVTGLHWGYSLLPAIIVLSLLVTPYVTKSTEIALGQVPLAYREGAEALGMAKTYLLRRVVLRSTVPGIATGIVVALAISTGETAPLLFTANYSNFLPTGALLHQPVGYLTYTAFTFFDSPQKSYVAIGADASLILVVLVLILILSSRLIVRLTQKYSPNRSVGGTARPRHNDAAE